MVICQVDVVGIPVGEAENDSPVCPDGNGPEAFHIALQRMEMETGQTHVFDRCGFIQLRQDGPYLIQQVGPNATRVVPLEEPLQTLAAEAVDRTIV